MSKEQTPKKQLEILVVEDNSKHLADAHEVAGTYMNIKFTYAETLVEAEAAIQQNRFDAVVTDAFFPADKSAEPEGNVAVLAPLLLERSIPYVINTAGNHHGKRFEQLRLPDCNRENLSGAVIEAYPEEINAEMDTKQWEAAINYATLIANADYLGARTIEVGNLLPPSTYGEYGQFTGVFQALLERGKSPEETITKAKQLTYGGMNFEELLKERAYHLLTGRRASGYVPEWIALNDSQKDELTETARGHYFEALELIRQTIGSYKEA